MVLLNNTIPFNSFGIDTQESRVNRIAYLLKTLPIFLFIQPENLSDLDEKTNIIAEDLIRLIKDDISSGNISFSSFYEPIKGKFTKVSFEIALYTWLLFIGYAIHEEQKSIEMDIEGYYDIRVDTILSHKQYDQSQEIAQFLSNQKHVEEELSRFNTIESADMDKIEIQKITFDIPFIIDCDLVEIFDRFQLSKEIPYINNGSERHKIFKGFKFLGEDWQLGDENFIKFYVLNTKVHPTTFQEKFYSEGVITLGTNKNEAILSIETVIGPKNDLANLVKLIFSTIQVESKSLEMKQQSVSSTVNFPKQSFNKYVLVDIITNNPMVSNFCYIDESINIGRKRQTINFHYHPVGADEPITIRFAEVAVESKDYRKNNQLYPLGSTYIEVKINKARDEALTREIAKFVGKILSIYNREKDGIISDYQLFLPNFKGEKEKKEDEEKIYKGSRLKDIVPEIFISRYARMCQKPPVIIDDQIRPQRPETFLVQNPTPEYKQAILFPKTAEEGPQHWYACPNGKYPGVRKNILENSDQFPLLPCCYDNPQDDKKKFKSYYLEQEIKSENESYSHILKTPKFLSKNELGLIPENLNILFQSMVIDEQQFYRTGTPRTPNSFLDVIAIATGRNQISRRNITPMMVSVCRQSTPEQTSADLQYDLNSEATYLNPIVWYRALEELTGCYIYVFTRVKSSGKLVYPSGKHAFTRYTRDPRRGAIIVLEHMGAESDAALYPQCELIVSINKTGKNTIFKGKFAEDLDRLYLETIKWYTGPRVIRDINPLSLPKNIVRQGIDSFGKVRTLVVNFKGDLVYLISPPLPPLMKEEQRGYQNNTEELILDYIQEEKMTLISKTPDRYIVRYNEMEYSLPYKISTTSVLKVYNENQRIARYLQEYAYYLYSLYLFENGLSPKSTNEINNFLRAKTVVVEGYVYPKIPRRFSIDSPYLQDKKLIVHSLEMAQRLGYGIEIFSLRYSKILENYHRSEWIREYYLDKNDFTQDNNTVIFMTEDSLKDWLNESGEDHVLYTFPQKAYHVKEDVEEKQEKPGRGKRKALKKKHKEVGTPYFLLLNGEVKLIQPADSLENGVFLAKQFHEKGFNLLTEDVDEGDDYMYIIFAGQNDLPSYGESENKVLIWKEDETLYYGAILSI